MFTGSGLETSCTGPLCACVCVCVCVYVCVQGLQDGLGWTLTLGVCNSPKSP